MADLRTRYIEDYAGGLLNIARQELSSTGEVLAQDGFVQNSTLFIEDGRGVKSGLRLGSALAECIDPVTETGVLNVRSADRTYAKIRDLKTFATAVASAQGALTESVTESFTNLEGAFESLENDVQQYRIQISELSDSVQTDLGTLTSRITFNESSLGTTNQNVLTLSGRILSLENSISNVTIPRRVSSVTASIADGASGNVTIPAAKGLLLLKIATDVAARVILYTDTTSRSGDSERAQGVAVPENAGVIADVVTTSSNLSVSLSPGVIGWNDEQNPLSELYAKITNNSGDSSEVTLRLTYIPVEN